MITKPKRWSAAVLAVGTVAALAGGAAPAVAEPASVDQTVLSVGHVDVLEVHYGGGQLALKVHDDTGSSPVTREPADVLLQALPGSHTTVPNDPAYGFLGQPGASIWVLPQVQNPNLLWPGWNTMGLSTGQFAGNAVTLTLTGVSGPGNVAVFAVGPFGDPSVRFNSGDGLPDSISVPVRRHAHANWAFTALGEYTLTFRATATLSTGQQVSTGDVAYSFLVGNA